VEITLVTAETKTTGFSRPVQWVTSVCS